MATLSEILIRRWPGRPWRLRNAAADDYATLEWLSADPKPAEAEIRAFSAEVDAEIAAERKAESAQRSILADRPDAILRAFEVLLAFNRELVLKLRSQSLSAPIEQAVIDDMIALKQRIDNARSG